MPTKIEKGIAKIAKLDVKEQQFLKEADAIQYSSPLCQLPPVHGRVLDKAIAISVKKAIIWNDIRNFILSGTKKTLWQIAVAQRLPTVRYGEERHLDFSASDLKNAIKHYKDDLKIPKGMTLQKSLTKTGGQMHFKKGGGKKKPKSLSTKKTKKRVKKGSDNLMTFGVKLPDVRTLEDLIK